MIVVAEPRSGGTKFCIDLAKRINKKFLGEPVPENLIGFQGGESWKNKHHEIKTQKRLTIDQVIKPKGVVLINEGVIPYLERANYFLLRKSCTDGLTSVYNIAIRTGYQHQYLWHRYMMSRYAIIVYCLTFNKDVKWYEDQPHSRPVANSLLSNNHYDEIRQFYESFISSSDIEKKTQQLLTFTQ